MLPREYYNLTPFEFELMAQGFRQKRKYDEALLRKTAVFIASAWGVKPKDAYECWQLEADSKKQVNSSLFKRYYQEKARGIIQDREKQYRKALIKWQTDLN